MSNMKKNVIWMVRDARGLNVYEKAFLNVVASRGTARTKRKTLMLDMGGISTGQLSNVVRSLVEKDLITVHEGFWKDGKKTPTMYVIREKVLATYVPVREDSSPDELGSSYSERGSSPHGGYKETIKETVKETSKETINSNESSDATAPVASSSSNNEIREEGESGYSFTSRDSTDLSKLKGTKPVYVSDLGIDSSNPVDETPESQIATPHEFDSRTAADWREIKKVRQLTKEENGYINAKAGAYMKKKRAEEEAKRPVWVGDDW